jgi:hypothetical protein
MEKLTHFSLAYKIFFSSPSSFIINRDVLYARIGCLEEDQNSSMKEIKKYDKSSWDL